MTDRHPKPCVDCRYHRTPRGIMECLAPSNYAPDPVYGDTLRGEPASLRKDNDLCGDEGYWWEKWEKERDGDYD